MANRLFETKLLNLVKGMVAIEGSFDIGATGAVSNIKGNGVSTVTRTAAGKYDIVLQDQYNKFLGSVFSIAEKSAGDPAADSVNVDGDPDTTVAASSPKVSIVLRLAGTAGDATSGVRLYFVLFLRNSTLKGKGES
jgi:hypothetical protein